VNNGDRRGESRLGILAFLGATALVLLALVAFARYPSLFRRGTEYHTVFRAVPGLNLGDEVRYGGLLVGSITGMELDPADPTRITVTFRVREETPIRADTRAAITQVGLLGAPFLNLEPGARNAPPLEPGSTLQSQDNLTFQDAMSRLAQFLDRADTLLSGVERVAGVSPWERFDRTLSRLDSLVMTANRGTERAFAGIDTSTKRLAMVLDRSERVLAVADTAMRDIGPGISTTQREALAAVRDLRVLVNEMRDALDNGERVDRIARDLASAADNVARLTARLESDPSSVLRSRRAPSKPAGPQPRD
jgi:phospholipid/cholesterol/gamma-HCH transport system substrate-binding protein